MIRLPIETVDRKRRGDVIWEAGKLSFEQGTLLTTEVDAVRAALHDKHLHRRLDADQEEEPEEDLMLKGPGKTPEEFMFHANFLPVAGFLPMFEDASGDDLASVT